MVSIFHTNPKKAQADGIVLYDACFILHLILYTTRYRTFERR